jgi:hypothetical protein
MAYCSQGTGHYAHTEMRKPILPLMTFVFIEKRSFQIFS